MISFVGASGCGKSTLMKLLLGLCAPESGSIMFDGSAIQRYGYARYRQKIGTVMQNDALLSGSIADNISFFDLEPDIEKIFRSAKQAAIHHDIAAMPMGYNSLVGDMGAALSAGQRQRILLARALYRDPEILILDEGTANLDAATENVIVQMISKLTMTRICVAHRQQVILASDRIALLVSGGLREVDKQELLNGQYIDRAATS
jgi:ATP-binding cassette subfamily B protein RaxB